MLCNISLNSAYLLPTVVPCALVMRRTMSWAGTKAFIWAKKSCRACPMARATISLEEETMPLRVFSAGAGVDVGVG